MAKQKNAVQAAEREVERWRGEIQKLEAEAEHAKAELGQLEHEWHNSALSARTEGDEAVAVASSQRTAVAERRLFAEESAAAVEAARSKLAEAEQLLEAARRRAVEELAREASAQMEEKRHEVFEAIEKLGAALDSLSEAAMKASGFEATLLGTYSLEAALAGRAGAPSVIYYRLFHAAEIAASIHASCRGKLSL